MESVHEETYRGYTIHIYPDEMPMDPRRDWDNHLGTMVCFHRDYDLGDDPKVHGIDLDTARELMNKPPADWYMLPLYLYDHGGITMSTGNFANWCDPGGWDTSLVGFIYMDKATFRRETRRPNGTEVRHITKADHERAYEYLRSEVKVYDHYLTGDVYGYTTESPDGKDGDSCFGYYGYGNGTDWEYMLSEARSNIDYDITRRRHEHYSQLKTYIRNHVPLQYREPCTI